MLDAVSAHPEREEIAAIVPPRRRANTPQNRQALQALVEASLPLVHQEAKALQRRLPQWIDGESLRQSGVVGLLDAVTRYDRSRGVPFKDYARYRIRGEIMEYLRSLDWASRQVREWGRRLTTSHLRLTHRLGREVSSEELAADLGVSLERYYHVEHRVNHSTLVSLEQLSAAAEGNWTPEGEASRAFQDPAAVVEQQDLREKLAAAIARLSPRERLVVQLYYHDELTLKAIGKRLGVTEGRACQILSQIIARLRQALQDHGPASVTLH